MVDLLKVQGTAVDKTPVRAGIEALSESFLEGINELLGAVEIQQACKCGKQLSVAAVNLGYCESCMAPIYVIVGDQT